MKLPPTPKWNKLTDDIDSEDYLRRAQEYERALLPSGIVLPRVGQVWQAVRDCEVWFRVMFEMRAPKVWFPKATSPFSDVPTTATKELQALMHGGTARLQSGERV